MKKFFVLSCGNTVKRAKRKCHITINKALNYVKSVKKFFQRLATIGTHALDFSSISNYRIMGQGGGDRQKDDLDHVTWTHCNFASPAGIMLVLYKTIL